MGVKDVLKESLEEIYLGNLGTVEADLVLPGKTRAGKRILWESADTELLEHDGKIHRPASEAGNRTVMLKATVTDGSHYVSKEYAVTILAALPERKFIRQLPMVFYRPLYSEFCLPDCVMLELEDGIVSLAVKWEQDGKVIVDREERYEIRGEINRRDVGGFCDAASYEIKYRIRNCPKQVTACVIGIQKEKTDEEKPVLKKATAARAWQVKVNGRDKFSQDMQRMKQYLLSIPAESLLFAFRAAAGLPTGGAKPMAGWEAPESNLCGHTMGHYLSAIALAYQDTGEGALKERAGELLAELERIQEKFSKKSEAYNGYLGAYTAEQFDALEAGERYPKVWAPYYTMHKIMAGVLECYHTFKFETALRIVTRMGLWVHHRLSGLTKEKCNSMWALYIAGEFGGINETLAELYQITGDNRFLETARLFDNDTLFYPMSVKVDVLGGMHANQHIPQVVGALKLYEVTGEKFFYDVAENFWNLVCRHHSYSIGGVGNTELFRNADRIGSELSEKNAESCCSYNMLKLTARLFEYEPESKYGDYYERVLLNHILANSCEKYGGATTYFMGLQPGARKNFALTENTCCHGTGLESKFRYGEGIYYTADDTVYVNLYLNSVFTAEDNFIISQEIVNHTRNRILIRVEQKDEKERTVKIRIPKWCRHRFTVEGDVEGLPCREEEGYLSLRKVWKNKEQFFITFSCFPYLLHPKDDPALFSVFYGPFVLALLSDSTEFIRFDYDEKELTEHIHRIGELLFELDGWRLKPLYQIVDERYHIYMRMKGKESYDGGTEIIDGRKYCKRLSGDKSAEKGVH